MRSHFTYIVLCGDQSSLLQRRRRAGSHQSSVQHQWQLRMRALVRGGSARRQKSCAWVRGALLIFHLSGDLIILHVSSFIRDLSCFMVHPSSLFVHETKNLDQSVVGQNPQSILNVCHRATTTPALTITRLLTFPSLPRCMPLKKHCVSHATATVPFVHQGQLNL